MEALVYTRSDTEYESIKALLEKEAELIDVYRDPLNGHSYFSHEYDIVVVALDGAQGMELVLEYSRRFSVTLLIWITDDPYFAGTAIRQHIFDFIRRPYEEDRLKESIQRAVPSCPNRDLWKQSANRRKE